MAKHHRTVDRITHILEHVARSTNGATLTELATSLGAAKSSIQSLVQGLIATGYLVEQGRHLHLGPGPYVLTLVANGMPARMVRHDDLVELARELDATVLLAVQVGEDIVYIDEVGSHPLLRFVAKGRSRRPLLMSAAGKLHLAQRSDQELQPYLAGGGHDPEVVHRFLEQVADIRARQVAINRGDSLPGVDAAAVPVRGHDGEMIAAVVVAGNHEQIGDRLERLAERAAEVIEEWQTTASGPGRPTGRGTMPAR
jgi:DNA-binding IclR family transcriptional regulator